MVHNNAEKDFQAGRKIQSIIYHILLLIIIFIIITYYSWADEHKSKTLDGKGVKKLYVPIQRTFFRRSIGSLKSASSVGNINADNK